MIMERNRKSNDMGDFYFLDFILLPLAFLTEYRLMAWSALSAAILWLFYRHFTKSNVARKFSIIVWRILLGIAIVATASIILLAVLSPKGPDFYRVVIGALSAVPLVLPAFLCYFIRPRDQRILQ